MLVPYVLCSAHVSLLIPSHFPHARPRCMTGVPYVSFLVLPRSVPPYTRYSPVCKCISFREPGRKDVLRTSSLSDVPLRAPGITANTGSTEARCPPLAKTYLTAQAQITPTTTSPGKNRSTFRDTRGHKLDPILKLCRLEGSYGPHSHPSEGYTHWGLRNQS